MHVNKLIPNAYGNMYAHMLTEKNVLKYTSNSADFMHTNVHLHVHS